MGFTSCYIAYYCRVKSPLFRIIGIVLLAVSLLLVGKFSSMGEWFNLDNITYSIKNSGWWGYLMFSGLFIIGSLIQIPAMIFVLAAILVYGPFEGMLISYLSVTLAMYINYLVIRYIGNNALHEIETKWVQRILLRLHQKPISTIVLLRLVFWASPLLNYTLAMTAVRPVHYVVGSSLGIILPLAIFSTTVILFQEIIIPLVS